MTTGNPITVLNQVPVGQKMRIIHMSGGKKLIRRLRSLGLTPGAIVEILQYRGRGVVVASNSNRIALGGGVAEKLLGERID